MIYERYDMLPEISHENKFISLKKSEKELKELNNSLLNSKSWKITKPLRKFKKLLKK